MKKDFIYFFRQVDLLRFNYLSPLIIISPTTMLLYTERQIKYKLYIIYSFFFSFLVLFSFFFLCAIHNIFSSTMQNNDEFNIYSTNAKPFSVLVILPH